MTAKKKAAKKPAKKTAPAVDRYDFRVGSRVKVRAGDWGNSKGTIVGNVRPGVVSVQLDSTPRRGPMEFGLLELQAL